MKKILILRLFLMLSVGAYADNGSDDIINTLGADEEGFVQLSTMFFKDQNSVYYYPDKIQGAESKNFEVLQLGDHATDYAKDGKNVYYKQNLVEDADVNSFKVVYDYITSSLAIDNKNVYKNEKKVGKSAFFKSALSKDCILQKHNAVVCYDDKTNKYNIGKMEGELIKVNEIYYKDNKNVYNFDSFSKYNQEKNYGVIISNDAQNFRVINKNFSKDSKSVYYLYSKIIGADPETFELLDFGNGESEDINYAIDKNNVFYQYSIVKGADPSTITMLDDGQDFYDYKYYAKDKNNVYFKGEILESENPSHFSLVDYADKTNKKIKSYYYLSLLLPILIDIFTLLFTYLLMIRNKKIELSFIKKSVLVLGIYTVVYGCITMLNLKIQYYIYFGILSLMIWGGTQLIYNKKVNILKDSFFYYLAIFILKFIIVYIGTLVMGIFFIDKLFNF